jgi:putative FmdB family regulatory protein
VLPPNTASRASQPVRSNFLCECFQAWQGTATESITRNAPGQPRAACYNLFINPAHGGSTLPLYEYECTKCHRITEKIEKVNGPHLKKCPHCGGKVEQLVSRSAIQFKGSGWYVTDYAGKKAASDTATGSSDKTDAKDSSNKDSDSKDSAKKDSAKESKETKDTKESKPTEKKSEKKKT